MQQHLTVEWIDPRGVVWDLTAGDKGVILDVGQSDLTLSPISHTLVRGDSLWAAATLELAAPSLKLLVADQMTGQEYYNLADEWWSKANSPFKTGILRFTRPDGEVRELEARLRDTPGTEWDYDPGAGIGENPGEAWLLLGTSPYYQGREQSVVFSQEGIPGAATPFYGPDGHGFPLYIAPASEASNLFVENLGQGATWPVWTLTGPISSARFGTEEGMLTYTGVIPAGETVVVSTRPGDRHARELSTGDNRYGLVSGVYAPIPVGDRVPITIVAEGMDYSSSITLTMREQFVKPF